MHDDDAASRLDDGTYIPIRSRETSGTDARARRSLEVFCRSKARTVPLARCLRCPHALGKSDTELCCADGARMPPVSVGAAMSPRVVCIRRDAAVSASTTLFGASGQMMVPVVDASTRFVGVLWRADLGQRSSRARDLEAPERWTREGSSEQRACDAMDPRDLTVAEDTPIARVAERMRAARVRALVVTSACSPGVVVGIVTDLDLLRWVAQNRRAA